MQASRGFIALFLLIAELHDVHAPRSLPTPLPGPSRPSSSFGASSSASDSIKRTSTTAVAATAAAGAAALAALAAARQAPPSGIPLHIYSVTSSSAEPAASSKAKGYYPKGGRSVSADPVSDTYAEEDNDSADADGSMRDDESDLANVDECADCDDDGGAYPEEVDEEISARQRDSLRHRGKKGQGKLWTAAQFPEGTTGPSNWDFDNILAAQGWSCPCIDRRNCIGSERGYKVQELHNFRKEFQTTANSFGGKRDAMRNELAAHYSTETRLFSRSFVVGKLNDCCAASAGLARGLAFKTYAQSRADLRKDRPLRDGRRIVKEKQESIATTQIESHIRLLRETLEGAKGREQEDIWHIAKMPVKARYEEYRNARIRAKLPLYGSLSLFEKIWRAHTEIRQLGAKSHAKCDTCGALEVEFDSIQRRMDPAGLALRADIQSRKDFHRKEHRAERAFAVDLNTKAEYSPHLLSSLNIDAPTQDQFDIPVQNRRVRDVVKSLESGSKWASKITGVLAAGVGMLAYASRKGLGAGANLTCTAVYLALLHLADQRGLGRRLNILFDNTCGDNKNSGVIDFIAYLVAIDAFQEASFFCMQKGHTFTKLDQSFNTMISQLMQQSIYTMSALLRFMFQFLRPYDVVEVKELHCLWDWKAFLTPHAQKLSGFATSQHGSGMHQIIARKDREGNVRVWFRASAQATSFFPEGPGYIVFTAESIEHLQGVPPLAPAKLDHNWGRTAVEGTIRAWYRYMVLDSSAQLAKVKSEWETTFDQLPADGNTNLLPPAMKLEWRELPRSLATCSAASAAVNTSGYTGISSSLENPPVNPIVGPGRSSAQVLHEVRAYQSRVRIAAADSPYPAVFQADYLFIQLPGRGIELHRVANSMVIDDAVAPKLSFSTSEYVHVAEHDQPAGFWGYFEQRPNPMYDSKDPRKGPQNIRHHNISRNLIMLYDVETFTVPITVDGVGRAKTVVRVSADSLQKLQSVCPDLPPMPQEIPSTHSTSASTAAGASTSSGRGRSRGASCRGGGSRGGGRGGRARGQNQGTNEQQAPTVDGCAEDGGASVAQQQPDRQRPQRQCASRRNQKRSRADADSSDEEESLEEETDSSDADAPDPDAHAEDANADAHAGVLNNDDANEEDDDPPAPIPDGYQRLEWEAGAALTPGQEFMIWTSLNGRRMATWHRASIVRPLDDRRGHAFTHDAKFGRERHPRGVVLSAESYDERCWVLLQREEPAA